MGAEKIDHPKCNDMWFVVPPAPTRITPDHLPAKVLAEATTILIQQRSLDQADDLDRLVSYLFLRKEAVESSRMEGTMSTIEHILTPGELFDDRVFAAEEVISLLSRRFGSDPKEAILSAQTLLSGHS